MKRDFVKYSGEPQDAISQLIASERKHNDDRTEYCEECRCYHLPPTWPNCQAERTS